MKSPIVLLSILLLTVNPGSAAEPLSPGRSIPIVVNFGEYSSASDAGNDEANVDWLDSDQEDDTVCTECFAALELQHYLEKIAPRTRFPIVDDDQVPEGELIVVGNPDSNKVARALIGVCHGSLITVRPRNHISSPSWCWGICPSRRHRFRNVNMRSVVAIPKKRNPPNRRTLRPISVPVPGTTAKSSAEMATR